MKLREIYNNKKPVISYEIFPPKGEGEELTAKISALLNELKELVEFNPSFISVTYGAGGSTRERTFELVLKIRDMLGVTTLPHFTCVGASKDEILVSLKEIQALNIKNILALRGDPPKGQENFVRPKDGFGYANELVEFIRANVDLGVAVAGYPEGHQEAESLEKDILNLKRKVDAGADVIITQLFFDNKYYYDFVEKTRNVGINIPIVPGILPVSSLNQLQKVTSLCKCTLPAELVNGLKERENNPEAMKEFGLDFAIRQCRDLIQNNVPGIHFYTLNKAFATKKVLEALDLNHQLV